MIQGYSKTLGISLFAVLFSVVQIFCVCTVAAASPPTSEILTSMPMQHNTGHEHANSSDKSSHDHGNETNCAHCDGDTAISTKVDLTASPILGVSLEKAILAGPLTARPARANMAPSALAGLRWLHPPTRTLVALKVLLLN